MNLPLLSETISTLVANGDWFGLRSVLRDLDESYLADVLVDLDPASRAIVFRLMPRVRAGQVLGLLRDEQRDELLNGLSDRETSRMLGNLKPDDRTALLEELPGEVTQRLLNLLSPEDLVEARQLLGYPEDSVGRLMTPDYVAVRPGWTVAESLEHIRTNARTSETVYVVYVVDERWQLLDALDLKHLIIASPEQTIAELMDSTFIGIEANADREEAVELMRRHDLFAMPVTDSDGVLVGIITVDDVLLVAQEEATEDFHKGAAVLPLDARYSVTKPLFLYRKRVGWLVALVFVNIASSGVIAAFEDTLEQTIALAFFIPLLIDSGGNTGAQSATLMVRALATGDVRPREWLTTLSKEASVGAALGLSMGIAAGLLGVVRGGVEIGIVVGLSMAAIVIVANLLGTLLPFLLTRFRVDPAAASSPLITSIADVTGLLLYFSIASLVIGNVT